MMTSPARQPSGEWPSALTVLPAITSVVRLLMIDGLCSPVLLPGQRPA